MDGKFKMIFKDPKRAPLWFVSRAWHSEAGASGWYVYSDRISPPVFVKDSEIDRVMF